MNTHILAFLLGKQVGAQLFGHRISMFNIGHCQNTLQSSCVILYFHQPCLTTTVAPYPRQHLVLSRVLHFSHVGGYSYTSLWFNFQGMKFTFPSTFNLSLFLQNTENMIQWKVTGSVSGVLNFLTNSVA